MGNVEAQGIEIYIGHVVIFNSVRRDLQKEETRDTARYGSTEPSLKITGTQYVTTSVLSPLAAILGDFTLFHSKKASALLKFTNT